MHVYRPCLGQTVKRQTKIFLDKADCCPIDNNVLEITQRYFSKLISGTGNKNVTIGTSKWCNGSLVASGWFGTIFSNST